MGIESIERVIIIGIAGIDHNIHQNILTEKMFFRKFHIEEIPDDFINLCFIKSFDNFGNGFVFQNSFDNRILTIPATVKICFIQPVQEMFLRMFCFANLFQTAIIQFIPVIGIDFFIEITIFVFPAKGRQNFLCRRYKFALSFFIHLLNPFLLVTKKGLPGKDGFIPFPYKPCQQKEHICVDSNMFIKIKKNKKKDCNLKNLLNGVIF